MDRKRLIAWVLAAAALGAVAGWLLDWARGRSAVPLRAPQIGAVVPQESDELDGVATDRAIADAIDYMLRVQDESGKFLYRINLDGVRLEPKYNVLRHAGAIYALDQSLVSDRVVKDEKRSAVRATALRAAKFLKQRYLRAPEEHPELLAIFSRSDEEALDAATEAKLGGAGLGLVALLAAQKIDASVISIDELQKLGAFILSMQNTDGSFRSKFWEKRHDPTPNSDDDGEGFVSLYYPGEAILGLVRLSEVDRDPKWIKAAESGINALIESRKGATQLPADHWLMIAMSERLKQKDVSVQMRARMIEHGKQLATSMLEERDRVAEKNPRYAGSFVSDGRSTPTATRLEGLIALYPHLSEADDQPLKARIEQAAISGATFLMRCQARGGEGHGGFMRALEKQKSQSDEFNARQAEIRIDYPQHALSALIGVREAL